jgi:alpha-glucosidase (family GH31 glycosyl hydrolase)
MIRHSPAGRGHAYRPSLDQRLPVIPREGEPLEVRALVSDDAGPVWLEVEVAGEVVRHDAQPLRADGSPGDDGDAAGDAGHLAAAAAAGEHIEGLHQVAVILPSVAGAMAYRWSSESDTTDWFHLTAATWQRGAGRLDLAAADVVADRLDQDSIEWLVDGRGAVRARFAVRLDDDEHVLGLGERFHALDHRGHAVDTQVFEQYKQQGERTYLPVPFVLVVGGQTSWGLHVDTTRRCWWDVGASRPDRLVAEVALDPAHDPRVDVTMFAGTPDQVVAAFLDVTGQPAAVPSWVFRPWASANEWNTQARVEAEIGRSLDTGVRVGVVVIEAWSDEATFTAFRDANYTPRPDGAPMSLDDFTFPADGAWPDPAGMVAWLHEHDVKVLLWQIPLLPVEVPDDRYGAEQLAYDRQALIDNGHAVCEADGAPYTNRGWWFPGALMPDFTSPEATDWWIAKRRYLVDELGIDGFKTDGGEHAWGDELRYADGTSGDVTNNRFPNLYAQAYHRLLDRTGREGVTFSRAGFTGAGTTPCHWAGDEDSTWEAFRSSILAGVSAGVSGVFAWGFDHGGFSGEIPSAELYLRSAAMAMLCPIMQYHAEYNHHRRPSNDRTPWNIADRHDAPEVVDIYRHFTELRERLVDYLDQQYHAGLTSGRPLMRPLALNWPRDQRIWDFPYQYQLGDHLLVAPVTQPGLEQLEVYLPEGNWVDVWDGSEHDGGRVHTVAAPIDQIPAFATDDAATQLTKVFAG